MRETFYVSDQGLSQAFSFISREIRTAGLADSVAQRISVIVDEVCANLIRHDSSLTANHQFGLDLRPGQPRTIVEISDPGVPFNPLSHENQHDQDIGGQGIAVVKGLAAKVSYERNDDHNILTIEVDAAD